MKHKIIKKILPIVIFILISIPFYIHHEKNRAIYRDFRKIESIFSERFIFQDSINFNSTSINKYLTKAENYLNKYPLEAVVPLQCEKLPENIILNSKNSSVMCYYLYFLHIEKQYDEQTSIGYSIYYTLILSWIITGIVEYILEKLKIKKAPGKEPETTTNP